MVTPIQKVNLKWLNNNIYIKREDLLPFSFGGNKLRIAEEYFRDMIRQKKDCIIGYGNPRSNLCRIISNLAFTRGIPCYIISPADDDGKRVNTNNSYLTAICNANIIPCSKQEVSKTVNFVINDCKSKGFNPYYINGDMFGKGNERIPVQAYYNVYKEIQKQLSEVKFEYIFLAVGTGMTLAGLLAGRDEENGNENIIGISVARGARDATIATSNYYKSFTNNMPNSICIDDSYINGGYGVTNYDEIATIRNLYCSNGILLDHVYTGKAFWGMKNYLYKNQIYNSNILFIHTGGTPLAFDLLNETNWNNDFRKLYETDEDRIILSSFLKENSNQFATNLKDVTDIDEFSAKVLKYGYVFGYYKESIMMGAICGYANDTISKKAFESVFVTSPSVRGTGVAAALFELQYEYCKSMGMQYIHFSTDKRNIAAKKFYEKQFVEIDKEKTDGHLIHYRMTI